MIPRPASFCSFRASFGRFCSRKIGSQPGFDSSNRMLSKLRFERGFKEKRCLMLLLAWVWLNVPSPLPGQPQPAWRPCPPIYSNRKPESLPTKARIAKARILPHESPHPSPRKPESLPTKPESHESPNRSPRKPESFPTIARIARKPKSLPTKARIVPHERKPESLPKKARIAPHESPNRSLRKPDSTRTRNLPHGSPTDKYLELVLLNWCWLGKGLSKLA